MVKTGKAFFFPILFFFCFIAGSLHAQGIKVEATVSEAMVFSGEYVEYKVTISGSGFKRLSKPSLPTEIQGFRIVSTNPSTSRSIQIINGKTSSSYSYGYYLVAEKAGNYTIPPVAIEIDGKQQFTNAIDIEVVDRNAAASANSSGDASSSASKQPDIYLEMEVDDTTPVVGQQLVINLVLYFKNTVDIQSYSPVPGWKAEGFWKEELNNPSRPTTEGVIINGERYRKAQLLQYALFPSKSGKLTISPFEIGVNVRYNRNNRDPFSSVFGGFGTNQRNIKLESNELSLDVKNYETPEGVVDVGAVGNFKISRNLSISDVTEGETIEVLTQFSGEGNVPLVIRPEYDLPESVEIYEPQEKLSINRNGGKISGRKVFSELVVARTPGEYAIPAVKLGFYDPDRKRYRVVELDALEFSVTPDARIRSNAALSNNNLGVQPYYGLVNWQNAAQEKPFSLMYILFALSAVLLIGGVSYRLYLNRVESDTGFARSRSASKKAKERLQQAEESGQRGEIKMAYGLLHQALAGYLTDKTNQPEVGLSDAQLTELALKYGLSTETQKPLRYLLDKCSTIRFAPMTSLDDLKSDIETAEGLIQQMRQQLKSKAVKEEINA